MPNTIQGSELSVLLFGKKNNKILYCEEKKFSLTNIEKIIIYGVDNFLKRDLWKLIWKESLWRQHNVFALTNPKMIVEDSLRPLKNFMSYL